MTTLREAVKAVLDCWDSPEWGAAPPDLTGDLMEALRAQLEQPEQEPVAWMHSDDHARMLETETFCTVYSVKVGSPDKGVTDVPLYTAQPQRKTLAYEEAIQLAREAGFNEHELASMRDYFENHVVA